MKKQGKQPRILLALGLGSLALALTSCRERGETARYISPEEVSTYLEGQGYQQGSTLGSYVDPSGQPITEEEALARSGRTTIRRGFGRFGISIGGGG